jgi:hypothetical protein
MTTSFSSTSFVLRLSLLAGLPACEMGARTVGYEPIDSVEPGVEHELTRAAPCAGPHGRAASDPAGSVALFVGVQFDDSELAPTYDVVDPEVTVRLERGTDLFWDWCNLPGTAEAVLEERWASPRDGLPHGTIEIDVDPGAPLGSLEFATVTLLDVTLHRTDDSDEPELVIDELVMPR